MSDPHHDDHTDDENHSRRVISGNDFARLRREADEREMISYHGRRSSPTSSMWAKPQNGGPKYGHGHK